MSWATGMVGDGANMRHLYAKYASSPYYTGASSYQFSSDLHPEAKSRGQAHRAQHAIPEDQALPAFTFNRQACSSGSV